MPRTVPPLSRSTPLIGIEPLTREHFAPFGDVIEMHNAQRRLINGGHATRYHDLAAIDAAAAGGKAILSLFAATPYMKPIQIDVLECHPLGSQAFFPATLSLGDTWLVVVAGGSAQGPDLATIRCFRAQNDQGVNYRAGCWHHPLLVLQPATFIVIDRDGPGNNLVEFQLKAAAPQLIDARPMP